MLLKEFYSVVHSEKIEKEFVTEIRINKDHSIYDGHFPGLPVTPGVILMQLFKEEAERQTNTKLQLEKASNVKFTAVVDPNTEAQFFLYSEILQEHGIVKLKGIAKHKGNISLKISSEYKIVP